MTKTDYISVTLTQFFKVIRNRYDLFQEYVCSNYGGGGGGGGGRGGHTFSSENTVLIYGELVYKFRKIVEKT